MKYSMCSKPISIHSFALCKHFPLIYLSGSFKPVTINNKIDIIRMT